ncbi:MAG: glycosyltransferase [Candidatus Marinimicrobia bacterium]|nr:glycosyltransferase [Candidatus Neomarinimicrobiota bacterium]
MTNNPSPRKTRILVAVLNWGLGHASRSIPIIKALKKQNTVVLASTGRSLTLLRDEFPDCEAIDFPDYNVRYSRNSSMFFVYLLVQIPRILARLFIEHYRTEHLVEKHDIDLIFSDNRYGVYSRNAPSYLMTHQLRFKLPRRLSCFEFVSVWFNRLAFRKFQHIIVPDIDDSANLTGNLGHPQAFRNYSKLTYIGFLSSIDKKPTTEPIDILFMISGPEPQRSVLEELILKQVEKIPGRHVVVLGKPGEEKPISTDRNLDIYAHLNRQKMSEYMSCARLIVSRAGYSTIMEVVALGKPALFVPTPGQTEQEYLALRLNELGYFHCVAQHKLNLPEDVKIAAGRLPYGDDLDRINDGSKVLSIMGLDRN